MGGNKGWGLALSFVGDGGDLFQKGVLLPACPSRGGPPTPWNEGLSLT